MQSKSKTAPSARRIKSIPLYRIGDPVAEPTSAEHWAICTRATPQGFTASAVSDAFLRLYRKAASKERHLTLIAPAPQPDATHTWGLQHFLTQDALSRGWLCAALRLSALCKVSLLLPQPALPTDLPAAKEMIEGEMLSLYQSGTTFDDLLTLGVTLGTPAALLDAARLCEEADFAVIDTDALLRLSFASEPCSIPFEQMLAYNDGAVLRLLEAGIDLLHRARRFAAVSGRLANDPLFENSLLDVGADAVLRAPTSPSHTSAFYI